MIRLRKKIIVMRIIVEKETVSVVKDETLVVIKKIKNNCKLKFSPFTNNKERKLQLRISPIPS